MYFLSIQFRKVLDWTHLVVALKPLSQVLHSTWKCFTGISQIRLVVGLLHQRPVVFQLGRMRSQHFLRGWTNWAKWSPANEPRSRPSRSRLLISAASSSKARLPVVQLNWRPSSSCSGTSWTCQTGFTQDSDETIICRRLEKNCHKNWIISKKSFRLKVETCWNQNLVEAIDQNFWGDKKMWIEHSSQKEKICLSKKLCEQKLKNKVAENRAEFCFRRWKFSHEWFDRESETQTFKWGRFRQEFFLHLYTSLSLSLSLSRTHTHAHTAWNKNTRFLSPKHWHTFLSHTHRHKIIFHLFLSHILFLSLSCTPSFTLYSHTHFLSLFPGNIHTHSPYLFSLLMHLLCVSQANQRFCFFL